MSAEKPRLGLQACRPACISRRHMYMSRAALWPHASLQIRPPAQRHGTGWRVTHLCDMAQLLYLVCTSTVRYKRIFIRAETLAGQEPVSMDGLTFHIPLARLQSQSREADLDKGRIGPLLKSPFLSSYTLVQCQTNPGSPQLDYPRCDKAHDEARMASPRPGRAKYRNRWTTRPQRVQPSVETNMPWIGGYR